MPVSGSDVVEFAKTQLGDPYVWGATGPNAFDCSGLVQYVYKHFGITTPRTTAEMQAGKGGLQTISESDLQPGDLILSKGWSGNQGHVGIYMGGGKLIEAGDPVQITTYGPSYKAHTTGYRRVPGVTGYGGSGGSGGVVDAVTGAVRGWVEAPKTLTDAMANVGSAMLGVAEGVTEVGKVAAMIGKLMLPSNQLRIALLAAGTAFVLLGIWFLSMEVRNT